MDGTEPGILGHIYILGIWTVTIKKKKSSNDHNILIDAQQFYIFLLKLGMKDVVNRFISRAEPWRFRIKKGNKKSSNDHIIIIDTAI